MNKGIVVLIVCTLFFSTYIIVADKPVIDKPDAKEEGNFQYIERGWILEGESTGLMKNIKVSISEKLLSFESKIDFSKDTKAERIPIKLYKREYTDLGVWDSDLIVKFIEVPLPKSTFDLKSKNTGEVILPILDDICNYTLKIGYDTVTYTGATDVVLVTGGTVGTPITFDDIYNADVAGGWGQVSKQGDRQYLCMANLFIGDSGSTETWVVDEYVSFQIGTAASSFDIRMYANSNLILNNSYLALFVPGARGYDSYGYLELIGSTLYKRGGGIRFYFRGSQHYENCYLDVSSWYCRDGKVDFLETVMELTEDSNDFKGTLYYYVTGDVNDFTVKNGGGYGIYVYASDPILKNTKFIDNTMDVNIQEGGRYITFINCEFDKTKLYLKTNEAYLLDKKEFDLKVIDEDNNAIIDAIVTIKDRYGNIVSYEDSTANLNEALDNSETGVDVTNGSQFSVNDVLLIDGEFMLVTNIVTNTLTVTRNYYGTPNYFNDVHGNGKDVFIVQTINTDASGKISVQLGYYRIFREMTESETIYTPHTLQISKVGYKTYETNFTLDNKTDWAIALENRTWNYSQPLAWKILNLTGTTILKLSSDGNLAISGELYELTNTPPSGTTLAYQINDTLWLTKSGDLYTKGELSEESNIIYTIGMINIIFSIPVCMYLYIRKKKR